MTGRSVWPCCGSRFLPPSAWRAAWFTWSAAPLHPRPAYPRRFQPIMDLSIIIPIKDERDNLNRLHDLLGQTLAGLRRTYEIIFVDDGSVDGSFSVLEELARKDSHVKVVRLRRNFGQSAALQAGIDWSSGDI